MGKPVRHVPVKLIAGLISRKKCEIDLATKILKKAFGTIDVETCLLDFSSTRYYEKEMGSDLKRKFLSFKRLIKPERSYRIKLITNGLEKKLSRDKRRTVNMDPGYISLTKLVLFTTKNRSHRIYLGRGIYADMELFFEKKCFRPFPWAYPDYKRAEYIDFFNSVRKIYSSQLT